MAPEADIDGEVHSGELREEDAAEKEKTKSHHAPSRYFSVFKEYNVSVIVRLNAAEYDKSAFIDAGALSPSAALCYASIIAAVSVCVSVSTSYAMRLVRVLMLVVYRLRAS